jgi:hypothetical protein
MYMPLQVNGAEPTKTGGGPSVLATDVNNPKTNAAGSKKIRD